VFHVKHDETLADEAEAVGAPLDAPQLDRLAAFEALLSERAAPLGLVAPGDLGVLRTRHVLDSLRAAPLVPAGVVADLGSGGGLPGIVVAIARSDAVVHLVESQRRRLGFLELAVERLGLSNAVPMGRRVESLEGPYDAVLARAFADADASWAAARRILAPAGVLVYFAGARFRASEVASEVRVEVVPPPPLLASAGPLAIMSRQ
jgi:16S rRNA (guanine527-N7)-methyltransferase